jgi:predicted small secreted protein
MDKMKQWCSGSLCVLALLAAGLFFSGCETAKGLGRGLASDVTSLGENIARDSRNAWDFLQASDRWMRENLW